MFDRVVAACGHARAWMRTGAFCGALCLAGWHGGAAAATDLMGRWQQAVDKVQAGDCRGSLGLLKALMRDKAFAAIDDGGRAAVYQLAASCAFKINDAYAGYYYALEGTRSGPGDPSLWQARLLTEAYAGKLPQVVDTLEVMAVRNPKALNGIEEQLLFAIYRRIDDLSDKTLRTRFLTVIAAPSYQPEEPLATGDFFKERRATDLIAVGDKVGAEAIVRRIVEPVTLMRIGLDPRFRSAVTDDFKARAAVEARLAHARDIAASHPDSLRAILGVARYWRRLGQSEEAIAALEVARPDRALEKRFTDFAEKQAWWWDELAYNYQMLGRYDDAVAAFQQGVAVDANGGGVNVSQTINLGYAHLRFGHPDRALETIATFDNRRYSASPYGEMEKRLVRGCANAALGNTSSLKADIGFAKSHSRDHAAAWTGILLCADDMDGAAASMVARLDDPERRVAALLELSDYDPRPAGYPQTGFEQKMPTLKNRADVRPLSSGQAAYAVSTYSRETCRPITGFRSCCRIDGSQSAQGS